ncbi:hypothetical protein OY671_007305 [Metschnikowia pulcherrima]|nr:hypothetical protein OY671_007305 [Metschnikowia pulcherrima]
MPSMFVHQTSLKSRVRWTQMAFLLHAYLINQTHTQAAAAKKSALKGTNSKKAVKVRTNTTFRLPNNLRLAKAPRYARKAVPHYPRLDAYKIIESPIASETAIKQVEDGNTLVFQVSLKSNKHQIKAAVKELYEVDVEKINTMIRPNGTKKAYIKLTADHDALDVANRIGYV